MKDIKLETGADSQLSNPKSVNVERYCTYKAQKRTISRGHNSTYRGEMTPVKAIYFRPFIRGYPCHSIDNDRLGAHLLHSFALQLGGG